LLLQVPAERQAAYRLSRPNEKLGRRFVQHDEAETAKTAPSRKGCGFYWLPRGKLIGARGRSHMSRVDPVTRRRAAPNTLPYAQVWQVPRFTTRFARTNDGHEEHLVRRPVQSPRGLVPSAIQSQGAIGRASPAKRPLLLTSRWSRQQTLCGMINFCAPTNHSSKWCEFCALLAA
jgi:hypothetical protein